MKRHQYPKMITERPHLNKLKTALNNEKCSEVDKKVIREIMSEYNEWKEKLRRIGGSDKEKVNSMIEVLNDYKNYVSLAIVGNKDAEFLRRQKGQLKIESSITEEFLANHLMHPDVIPEIRNANFISGPREILLSMSFTPRNFEELGERPALNIEKKKQDFTIGTEIFYKLSLSEYFSSSKVDSGKFTLAVLAAECKRHLDKTMYRESIGAAAQLKNYVPFARYYIITDFLDMEPANPKVTKLDNVFILRRAKRLPVGQRNDPESVRQHLKNNPINEDVAWRIVKEIRDFLSATWFEPDKALDRGFFA